MADDQTGTAESRQQSKQSRFPLVQTLLLVILLLLLAGLSYLFLNRQTGMENQISDLSRQVQDLLQHAEVVADQARSALVLAKQAQEEAQIAAEGRARAEAAQSTAEAQAAAAEQARKAAEQRAQSALEEAERIRAQRVEEMNRLKDALSQIVETRRTALGVVMNLGSDAIEFDFDKASLRPENRELLSRIAGVLLTSKGYRIQIYGHTDDVGTADYNQVLSERRAQVVSDYLVEVGIESSIVSTKGFGRVLVQTAKGIGDNGIWRIAKLNGILYLPDVGSKTTSFSSAFAGIFASN